jgi:hypothetical protein
MEGKTVSKPNRRYLILMLLLLPSTACAQSLSNNVQCLLLSIGFSTSKDAKAQGIAKSATLFFAGRVSQVPAPQLRSAVTTQQRLISPATAGLRMTACAKEMESSLRSIQAIGKS